MPDMTCLDTSCFGEMNRGNKAVAQAIEDLIRSGESVAVPDAVYQELQNTSDPVTRAADMQLIKDLNIKVLPKPSLEARGDMYDIHSQYQSGDKNRQGQDIAGQAKKGGAGGQDVVVIAQVMYYTKNKPDGIGEVRLFTMERMKNNQSDMRKNYGINFSPKCSINGVGTNTPRVSYSEVRGYFNNLKPIHISPDGATVMEIKPVPRGGSGGGGGGTTTITIQPKDPNPGFKGSPADIASRQEALNGGITLGLQIADFGLNKLNDIILKQAIQAELDKINLTRNSSQGALVVIYCRRPDSHPDSMIHPGDRFDHLEYGFGVNADDARAKMRATPAIRPGADEKVAKMVSSERWYPPAQPVGVDQLPTPYPKLALAGFAFGKAKLQDVEWNGTFGFDDEGETTLTTGNSIPSFFILKPPPEIKWVTSAWATDRHSPPLLEVDTSKGGKITVVNLDPDLKFWGVSAAMVFPANEETWVIFQQGPETKGSTGQLGRQNINKLRWVRPENLEIIRRI